MGTESQPYLRRILGLLAGIALVFAWALGQDALAAVREHVVRSGESLWSIAAQELGSGERWRALYRANRDRVGPDPRLIHPGLRLEVADKVAHAAGRYRVRRGDSLWTIAERKLGAGERWKTLYERNRDTIGADPRLIRPGIVIVLGERPAAVAARQRARRDAAARPAAKPVAKAPAAKPEAKAPIARPVAKPEAKAPVARPVAKPEAKAPPRNPFEYKGGPAPAAPPAAAGTPPGRNPFAFGADGTAPGAKTLPGQAQRRVGGMPVVPSYPEERAAGRSKGAPPVAVDVRGGKPVAKAKKKGRRHLASSPVPTPRKH